MTKEQAIAKIAHESHESNEVKKRNIVALCADFRKEKLSEIKEKVAREIERQEKIRATRKKYYYWKNSPYWENRYAQKLDRKNAEKENWKNRIRKAISVKDALQKTYRASWNIASTKIKISQNVIAEVTWDEESDWNYYSKSYGRPKNTYSNRRVEFYFFDTCAAEIVDLKTYPVANFQGNFLLNILVDFLKIEKIKVKKEEKIVQLNPYFSIEKIFQIGSAKIYKRSLGAHLIDFCAVQNDLTYHDDTPKKAIHNLKIKIKNKIKWENEKLSKQTAYAIGACEAGLKQFCIDNDLDIDAEYSRQEIEEKINQNREINKKYHVEFKKAGIKF